MGSGAPIQDF